MTRQNNDLNNSETDRHGESSRAASPERTAHPDKKTDATEHAEREEPIQQFREGRRQRRSHPAQRP